MTVTQSTYLFEQDGTHYHCDIHVSAEGTYLSVWAFDGSEIKAYRQLIPLRDVVFALLDSPETVRK